MTTNTHARTSVRFDYELHHYRTGSEIRAIPEDGPEQIVAEFPSIHDAEIAWEQIMDAL